MSQIIRGTPGDLPRKLTAAIVKRIADARIGVTVVQQAKRRMTRGGDSTHTYPDLWNHPRSMRRGGQPLLDTKTTIYAHLNSAQIVRPRSIEVSLRSGGPNPKVALYHQHGFKTKGPNFIPLTAKAKRNASKFGPLMKKRSAILKEQRRAAKARGRNNSLGGFVRFIQRLRAVDAEIERAGFIEGETYIMAWNGVDVPMRKIFNLPPEDIAEIKRVVKKAFTSRSG